MQTVTTKEVAAYLNVKPNQVTRYIRNGRLIGAKKKDDKWLIPADTIIIPPESKTQRILNYIDSLSDEEKAELSNAISENMEYLRYWTYLLENGYITKRKKIKVNKEKLTVKKYKQKKTWFEIVDLIGKIITPLAVAVIAKI